MKNNFLLKIVILLMSFAMMGDSVIVPIVPNIFEAFPDASPFLQNFIISGPMLIAIPATLICGKLAQFISKKYLLIFSYLIAAFAGIGIAFVDSVFLFVLFRSLLGITFGFLAASAFGLIAELFKEEKERSSVMGWYNSMTALFGVLIATASGYIAVSNWHYSFFINIAAIPIVLLMIFVLPVTPPEGKVQQDGDQNEKQKMPYLKVGALSVSAIVYNALYMILFYFVAVYLQEANLGDASTAGIMSSVGTVGSFVAGMIFANFYGKVKRFTPATFFLVLAACYFVLSMDVNLLIVGIAVFVAGWTYNLSMSYYFLTATMIVPPAVLTLSTGITNASIGLGCYLAPSAINWYQEIFNVPTLKGTFLYVALTLVVCGVISIILAMRHSKNLPVIESQDMKGQA
ncbi:MFS transporter [Dehalobacterium formicoaceticum]|uniref:MFS transporter n=1 Tax=Dehalobacterium formicoaceticum TaxID=51515 RepID=UPI000B7E292C|nr:MFS transporter [Dehalobacterium formicoaceticum]